MSLAERTAFAAAAKALHIRADSGFNFRIVLVAVAYFRFWTVHFFEKHSERSEKVF